MVLSDFYGGDTASSTKVLGFYGGDAASSTKVIKVLKSDLGSGGLGSCGGGI